MPATLAQMRGRVKFALGNKQNIDDTIDGNLNEATLQHTLRTKPQEMQESTTFSTVDAQFQYDLTGDVGVTDLYSFLYIRDNTDDTPILLGNETEFNATRQDATLDTNKGDPRRYLHIETDLVLYAQIPDATTRTIGVRYIKRPATMTSVVSFPLNDEHIRPVEQLAKALTWLDLGNEAKAGTALQSYEALIQSRNMPEQEEDLQSIHQLIPIDNLIIE